VREHGGGLDRDFLEGEPEKRGEAQKVIRALPAGFVPGLTTTSVPSYSGGKAT